MEHQHHQETSSPLVPVIPRLDRLDRLLQLLEEKHRRSLLKRDTSPAENNCTKEEPKALSSALDEVQHKGTLMERLARLENRLLQLSMEMDEGNTSKSSSSTVQASEMTCDFSIDKGPDENRATLAAQEKQDPSTIIKAQEEEDSCGRERKARQKGRGQKRKTTKKWVMGLLRSLRC